MSILMLVSYASAATSRCDILIEGAVDTELQPLLAALKDKRPIQIGAWTFWSGRIGQKQVVISRTDMGPINAVAATVLGIQRFRPKLVINQGTAGAHDPALNLWDIVIGAQTTDYSAYKSARGEPGAGVHLEHWEPIAHLLRVGGGEPVRLPHFTGETTAVEAALKVANPRGRVVKGNIGSGFQYNRELDMIAWLHKTYQTDSEDMESAYAHGAALGLKTAFVAIRIISDSEYSHPKFERIAGQYCAEFVLEFIRSLP